MKAFQRLVSGSVLFFGLMAFIRAHGETAAVADEGEASYAVRVIAVPAASRDAFVTCLLTKELPFWRRLKKARHLVTSSVFESISVVSSEAGIPSWNFLLLTQIPPDTSADRSIKSNGHSLKNEPCELAVGAILRRVEMMRTTPNSNYARATTAGDIVARKSKTNYVVEYIAVKDTQDARNRYRDNMRINVGPAESLLIQDGWDLSFVALETVSVEFSGAGMPNWNQIHIGAYTERSSTKAGELANDAALRRVNPQSGGLDGVYGDLDSYRTKPKTDNARQLFELAVR
jgi:hypothetical protein